VYKNWKFIIKKSDFCSFKKKLCWSESLNSFSPRSAFDFHKTFTRNETLCNRSLYAFAVQREVQCVAYAYASVSETLVARPVCRNDGHKRLPHAGVKSRCARARTRFLFLLRLWNVLCYAARSNNNCLDFPFSTRMRRSPVCQ